VSKPSKEGFYPPAEEMANIISHGIGVLLSIAALVMLVTRASLYGDTWHVVSFSIFGASLILLYVASTIYHSVKSPALRKRLRVMDHASIYVLIAGTYTPFALVTLKGPVGWWIFGISWGLALAGIVLKLFFTGKFKQISTLMYVILGWIIIFAIQPLMENLSTEGLLWLLAGGVAYTVGAALYSIKRIRFNHAIFHMFVLAGSASHFVSVFYFVLPAS
jgi:hemolysin III